jgi:hypothetical protein
VAERYSAPGIAFSSQVLPSFVVLQESITGCPNVTKDVTTTQSDSEEQSIDTEVPA